MVVYKVHPQRICTLNVCQRVRSSRCQHYQLTLFPMKRDQDSLLTFVGVLEVLCIEVGAALQNIH